MTTEMETAALDAARQVTEVGRVFLIKRKKSPGFIPTFNVLIRGVGGIRGFRIMGGKIHSPSLNNGQFQVGFLNREYCIAIYEKVREFLNSNPDIAQETDLMDDIDKAIIMIEMDNRTEAMHF